TRRRAVLVVGPVRSVRDDPLSLMRRQGTWARPQELFVHPPPVRLDEAASGFLRDLEGTPSSALSSSAIAFHALPDSAPADAPPPPCPAPTPPPPPCATPPPATIAATPTGAPPLEPASSWCASSRRPAAPTWWWRWTISLSTTRAMKSSSSRSPRPPRSPHRP